MSCGDKRFEGDLEALLEGDLAPDRYAALRAHATTCDACRTDYERISQVDSRLERRALPAHRQELLQSELFSRLGVAAPKTAQVIRPARWSARRVVNVAVPLAASVILAVLIGQQLGTPRDDGFQPRGAGTANSYGVRAFCVDAAAQVIAEARPGQTLRCAPGNSLQFSHTGAQPVGLRVVGAGEEPLHFFPPEGGTGQVAAGTDVPLPFSTPVRSDWLSGPLPVTATFVAADGKVLSETTIVVTPR